MREFFYRDRNKELLKRLFIQGRGRAVGRPLYNVAIDLELAYHRAVDRLLPPDLGDQAFLNDNLTAVIKTFERPAVLARLLSSIRRFYPGLPVIVVDDSREPQPHPGVWTITMPFNSGLSAGRNEGVRQVETPYLLLLDDDFVFYRHTDLISALVLIESEPRIDIMGGAVVNLPFFRVADYSRAGLYPTKTRPVMPPGSSLAGLTVYDKVPNFFIARTEGLRRVKWDENLKLLEHAEFFTRAKGVLCTVYNSRLRCFHARTYFNKQYMAYRQEFVDAQKYILAQYYGYSGTENGENSAG
jgi:glycosyltransferase involved in cell wall biosynthesis